MKTPVFSALLLGCTLSAAPAQVLRFDFNADAGSGTVISTGSDRLEGECRRQGMPEVVADLWSADGAGVTGKKGDFALDLSSSTGMGNGGVGGVVRFKDVQSAVGGLKAFTLCGWFKADQQIGNGARLFDALDEQGSGFILLCDAGKLALQANKGGWVSQNLEYTETGEWVFFAVAFDAASQSQNLTFYKGTAAGLDSQTLDAAAPVEALPAQPIMMTIGNNVGYERPLQGLLDNLEVHAGALDEDAVTKIFKSTKAAR
jgi:hypothetical protein